MSLGALGYVGYAKETTEGTVVAPTVFLPVSSFSFEDTNDYLIPDQIRHGRDRSVLVAAPFATSGTMDMELITTGFGQLLRSAMAAATGDVATTANTGGGFQHIITPGNGGSTYSFESSMADILIMRYGGIRVNTLEISGTFGEIVTASFGLEGTTRVKQVTPATVTNIPEIPLAFSGASVKVAGTDIGNVKAFTWTIGNNLDRIGTLRKTRSWKRTALGMRDVGLSLTMDFTDTADYDLFLAETEFSVQIDLEGPTVDTSYFTGWTTAKPKLTLDFPRVRWGSIGVPLSSTEYLEQSVEAVIVKGAATPIMTATLISKDTTIT